MLVGWISTGIVSAVTIEGFVPERVEIYKQIDDITLSLYVFLPSDWTPDDRRPAVIWFHGGGWVGGSPTQMFPHSRYFALRGAVGISVEYRLGGRHHTTPFESVQDAASAIHWVRAHAAKLGVDPSRIAAGGASSGGHLAAILGNGRDGTETPDAAALDARPNLLLLLNPGLDLVDSVRHAHRRSEPRYVSISPFHTLTAGTPPMMIIHAEDDQIIPCTEPQAYKRLADSLGVRCDLHLYPGRHHGFFNYVVRKDDFESSMMIAHRFLAEFGWIPGESILPVGPLSPDIPVDQPTHR